MSKNIKFYLLTTLIFVAVILAWFLIGFVTVGYRAVDFLNIGPEDKANLGLMNLLLVYAAGIGGGVGGLFGLILSLFFIRRLAKRWDRQLTFGKHPVLKLTGLAFITFLIIAFILLAILANLK